MHTFSNRNILLKYKNTLENINTRIYSCGPINQYAEDFIKILLYYNLYINLNKNSDLKNTIHIINNKIIEILNNKDFFSAFKLLLYLYDHHQKITIYNLLKNIIKNITFTKYNDEIQEDMPNSSIKLIKQITFLGTWINKKLNKEKSHQIQL